MSVAATVARPCPEPSCPVGSFACLEGHRLPTPLLQGPERTPRAHGHGGGGHQLGVKEATEQPGKPPRWPIVGIAS